VATVSGTDAVMSVYPVATGAMVAALGHDLPACEQAYRTCLVALRGHASGSVREALDDWRAAMDAGAWPEVSTRLWQLMCALPIGFPPDPSRLLPRAGPEPQVLRACSRHGAAPEGVWWRFCPQCGEATLRVRRG